MVPLELIPDDVPLEVMEPVPDETGLVLVRDPLVIELVPEEIDPLAEAEPVIEERDPVLVKDPDVPLTPVDKVDTIDEL